MNRDQHESSQVVLFVLNLNSIHEIVLHPEGVDGSIVKCSAAYTATEYLFVLHFKKIEKKRKEN